MAANSIGNRVARPLGNVIALVGHMPREEQIAVRDRIAAVVERLTTVLEDMIAALDQLDGDSETEEGNDEEPELGWAETEARWGRYAPSTGEPSLGWTATINQAGRHWRGGTDDAEAEHDGREPDYDAEDGGDDEAGHDVEDCELLPPATGGISE